MHHSSMRKSSLIFWGKKKTTEQIVISLAPGHRESLKIRDDGLIMQGNTRIKILQERGYDISRLPHERYVSEDVS
jgi:hypothetical protein